MTDRIALSLQCATQINKDGLAATLLSDAQAIFDWYKEHETVVPEKKRLVLDAQSLAHIPPKPPKFHRPVTLGSQHNSEAT